MVILAIETSCDETAVSIVEASNGPIEPKFKILAQSVASQIATHTKYGGVVPSIAKREHAKLLLPILISTLKEAGLLVSGETKLPSVAEKILAREPELLALVKKDLTVINRPMIDAIAVTRGPGLEPTLWVGINFAKLLALAWSVPLIPVNHLEGHIVSPFLTAEVNRVHKLFPAIALIISGGHTELVLLKNFHHYQIIGRTRDDAVGEAFDKVARLMNLPYPGGPEISRLAAQTTDVGKWNLPRPMINSADYDFSFSGLKTAVRYAIEKHGSLSDHDKETLAREFQNAVIEVLLAKTLRAIQALGAKSLIIGGGVVANQELRQTFQKTLAEKFFNLSLFIPPLSLATDNATMIAAAGYLRFLAAESLQPDQILAADTLIANGNLSLT